MRKRAFTLVELLVVIGIIVVLIGILLPMLSRARSTAVTTVCLNNLRQMGIVAQAYVNENHGRYPSAQYTSADFNTFYCWDLTTTYAADGSAQVTPGLLWQTNDPLIVQQCPAFEGTANWGVDPYTGYNYNTSYIGHGQGESVEAPAKAVTITNPSQTALFGDGQWAGGADKFMRAPYPNIGDASFDGRWAGTQGFRHDRLTNVVFCDGHGESLGQIFTANADGAVNVAAGTGFLSADNQLYGQQ
jgi:prepilin-type N-terminal cleavage/methylation domain-containing protein/prepilin-type processing-associated H-X9-DG protein